MDINPVVTFFAIFTVPVVYLVVEEREGRRLNPAGLPLFARIRKSFRRLSGGIIGALVAGLIVGFSREDWLRGVHLAFFTVGATATLALHDAVRSLKDSGPNNDSHEN
jgi:hypothetical protein